jgi:hypoxanthine phosphoribosyltransferase
MQRNEYIILADKHSFIYLFSHHGLALHYFLRFKKFYQHLLEALQDLKQGYCTEFLRVSSYHGTSSTGNVQIAGGLKYEELAGKDLILVEDIIDTGTTLSHLMPILTEKAKPKSMEVCTLLTKRLPKPAKVEAKYAGFSIPNHFIIGYGLDHNELYRDLKDIWVISQKGIEVDSKTLLD